MLKKRTYFENLEYEFFGKKYIDTKTEKMQEIIENYPDEFIGYDILGKRFANNNIDEIREIIIDRAIMIEVDRLNNKHIKQKEIEN